MELRVPPEHVQGLLWLWLSDPAEGQVLQKKGLQACRTLDQGSGPPNRPPTCPCTSVPLLCRAQSHRSAPFCQQCLPEQGVKVLLCALGMGWDHPSPCALQALSGSMTVPSPAPAGASAGHWGLLLFASVCWDILERLWESLLGPDSLRAWQSYASLWMALMGVRAPGIFLWPLL